IAERARGWQKSTLDASVTSPSCSAGSRLWVSSPRTASARERAPTSATSLAATTRRARRVELESLARRPRKPCSTAVPARTCLSRGPCPASCGAIESAEPELGNSRRGEVSDVGLPYAEEHRDAVSVEAARDEGHRSGRSLVEPVGVVDYAQQRLLLGDGRKQTQGAAEDGEALGDDVRAECQCRSDGDCLRFGNRVDRRERWAEELVQPGERDVHLGLDAERAEDPHVICTLDGGVK